MKKCVQCGKETDMPFHTCNRSIEISEEARRATFIVRQYFNRPWETELVEFKDEVAIQIQLAINSATEKLTAENAALKARVRELDALLWSYQPQLHTNTNQ